MSSSTDNGYSNSSDIDDDDDDDLVFYDANTTLSTSEITAPLQQEPRWRISSKPEPLQTSEQFNTIPLTEKQLNDIERRDKLQRLRDQDKPSRRSTILKSPNQSSSIVEQESDDDNASSGSEIPNVQSRRSTKSFVPSENLTNSSPTLINHQKQRQSSYSVVPGKSARGTGGHYSHKNSMVNSDPNVIDLTTIDSITRFGELSRTGRKLSDDEILQQPIVRNLDSGKYVPFTDANPMTETILQRARGSSFVNDEEIHQTHRRHSFKSLRHDDNESTSSGSSSNMTKRSSLISSNASSKSSTLPSRMKWRKAVVKNIFRRTKSKLNDDQHNTGEIDTNNDDDIDLERISTNDGSNGDVKYKVSRHLKEATQFDKTQLLQTIVDAHDGPIWCMRFSPDGHLLATCGQDSLLKVWILKSAKNYFSDTTHSISNTSQQQDEILINKFNEFNINMSTESMASTVNIKLGLNENQAPFYAKPFCQFIGHQAPVLDAAWSKSLFLLSSSMDKTVRLWHLSRAECLCFFRHVDFVSAIAFHPRDDRYFVSASLDGHVRLWNIPDKRVVFWTLIPIQASSQVTAAQANLITAINFCDEGRKVTVGTFDGRFLIYTDSLQYDTVMNIGDKDGSGSHRSRKKRRKPYKITGIESMNTNDSKVLITSNDSRIRVYNTRTKEIEHGYRGYSNQSSQIRASFSHDDQYIISGSEDGWFYIWRTEAHNNHNASSLNAILTRKQRNFFDDAYERIQVHNTMVTSAIFAPNPNVIMNYISSFNDNLSGSIRSPTPSLNNHRLKQNNSNTSPNLSETPTIYHKGSIYVMVTADSGGQLKILVNRYHR